MPQHACCFTQLLPVLHRLVLPRSDAHELTVMTQDGKLMTASEMIRHIEEEHARKQRELEQALR